ncbi:50S ribosomal protein L5 [Candidatus Pacearchaeota archaeon]|nr:50S ribosomal protein L5 [Candidatus Pacearchaeota archaeon]
MKTKTEKEENPMRRIKITKVLISAGAVGPELEKSAKLLEIITGMKAQIIRSGPRKRIPAFGVKPNMPLGTRVTIRGGKINEKLKQLLGGIGNTIYEEQVQENHFSFGIKEYIEVPGLEYKREIGIRGFNVTIVFERPGVRVKNKKIKGGKIPGKQHVTREEIINFMEENFKTKFI